MQVIEICLWGTMNETACTTLSTLKECCSTICRSVEGTNKKKQCIKYMGGMQVIEICLWGIMEMRRTLEACIVLIVLFCLVVGGYRMGCRTWRRKEGTHRLIIPQSLHPRKVNFIFDHQSELGSDIKLTRWGCLRSSTVDFGVYLVWKDMEYALNRDSVQVRSARFPCFRQLTAYNQACRYMTRRQYKTNKIYSRSYILSLATCLFLYIN